MENKMKENKNVLQLALLYLSISLMFFAIVCYFVNPGIIESQINKVSVEHLK